MLEVNQKAPVFTLKNQNEQDVSLSDFSGKKVVLYFYPKDNTPGCTQQALGFKELFEEFNNKNTVIIGISKDSILSHQKFIEKYQLPFILLSDPNLDVIKLYDAYGEKKLYGKVSMGVIRTTYVINELGFIEKIYKKVKAKENASEIICTL